MDTFETIVERARALTIEQRKRLIMVLVESLTEEADKPFGLLEFEGMGERLRDEVDLQEHICQLRGRLDRATFKKIFDQALLA
ncbi:MAG: hypothetical protein Kow00106_18460 [Anaerolineae bacterium]